MVAVDDDAHTRALYRLAVVVVMVIMLSGQSMHRVSEVLARP